MKLKNMMLSDTSLLPFRIISLEKATFKLRFKEQNMSELGKDSFGEGIAIQGPGLAKQYSIQEIEIRSI